MTCKHEKTSTLSSGPPLFTPELHEDGSPVLFCLDCHVASDQPEWLSQPAATPYPEPGCPGCGGRISDRYRIHGVCHNCYGTTDDPGWKFSEREDDDDQARIMALFPDRATDGTLHHAILIAVGEIEGHQAALAEAERRGAERGWDEGWERGQSLSRGKLPKHRLDPMRRNPYRKPSSAVLPPSEPVEVAGEGSDTERGAE